MQFLRVPVERIASRPNLHSMFTKDHGVHGRLVDKNFLPTNLPEWMWEDPEQPKAHSSF